MLLRHSAAYLLARGIPALASFLSIALFTRLLTPADYGAYTLVLTVTTFGNILFFEWLQGGVLRYRARYDQDLPRFLSTVVAGYLVALFSSALVALMAAWVLQDYTFSTWLPWTWLLLALWGLFELTLKLKVAESTPLSFGLLNTTKTGLVALLGSWAAWQGFGAHGLVMAYAAAILLALLAFGRQGWKRAQPSRVDWRLLRQLVDYGLPLTATFTLAGVIASSDRLILGWLGGTDAAGLYAAGYDLPSQALGVSLGIIYLAAYPLAVRALEQKNPALAQQRLDHYARLLFGLGMPAAAGLAVLAPAIAHLVLGEAFRASAQHLIPVIALAALLGNLKAFYFDLAFQLGQNTRILVRILAMAAVVNILLNLLLIPRFGVAGAAWATLVAQTLALGSSAWLGRHHFHLPWPGSDALRILLAVGLMGAMLWPLRDVRDFLGLVITILLGALGYGLGLLAFDAGGLRVFLFAWAMRPRRTNP